MTHDIHSQRRDVRIEISTPIAIRWLNSLVCALAVALAAIILTSSLVDRAFAQQNAPGYLPPADQKKFVRQKTEDRKTSPVASKEKNDAAKSAEVTDEAQPRDQESQSSDVAVIIGNKFYQHDGVHDTAYAYRDADAVRQLLIENYGFRPEKIIWLKDTGQAEMRAIFGTKNNVQGRIWRTIDPKGASRLFVYYSGHGTHDIELQKPHILPVDTGPADIAVSGYPLDLLYSNLSKLPVKDIFVMLEASFSGRSQTGMLMENAQAVSVSARMPKNIKTGNFTVLAAADGKQYANIDDKLRHGMFTAQLLSGLKGAADADNDGRITARELHKYAEAGVSGDVKRDLDRQQTPKLFGNADFVIGEYRKNRVAAVEEPETAEDASASPAPEPEDTSDGKSESAGDASAAPVPEPEGSSETAEQTELAYWNEVKDSKNVTGLQGYLERFPEGKFSSDAKQKIQDMEKQYASLSEGDADEKRAEQEKQLTLNKDLQKALKTAGCYSGRIDGVWGAQSRSALKRFADRVKKDVNSLEATEANLDLATSETQGRVCPAERRQKPEQNYAEDGQRDRYDDGGEERDAEYDEDDSFAWREFIEEQHEAERRGEVCWSNRNRIVSCDDPRATFR